MHYPQHIAIIADGNRTWAKEQWLSWMDWHFAWAKRTLELMEHIYKNTEVKVFTWRFLSTENLKNRPPEEVSFIFSILQMLWNDIDALLEKYHINFRWVWNRDWLPSEIITFLDAKQQKYAFVDTERTAVFGFNYGWRDEILRGIKALSLEDIAWLTEESFSKKLDFGTLPALDLVIRTKWEVAHRTSWFMSWWIGYAELYFAKDYYPAFSNQKIDEAIQWFDSIYDERNYWK